MIKKKKGQKDCDKSQVTWEMSGSHLDLSSYLVGSLIFWVKKWIMGWNEAWFEFKFYYSRDVWEVELFCTVVSHLLHNKK